MKLRPLENRYVLIGECWSFIYDRCRNEMVAAQEVTVELACAANWAVFDNCEL